LSKHLSSLWRGLTGRLFGAPAKRRVLASRPRGKRPGVEALEERTAPAILSNPANVLAASTYALTTSGEIHGADNVADTLTTDPSGGLMTVSVTFTGGSGDRLALTGQSFHNVSQHVLSAGAGVIGQLGPMGSQGVISSGVEAFDWQDSAITLSF